MDDQELAAIRAARLSQLQQKTADSGQAGFSGIPANINAQGAPNSAEDDAKRAAEEQMRRDLLATVLDSAARERRMLIRRLLFFTLYSYVIEMVLCQ